MKPLIGIAGDSFMNEPGRFVSAEKEYCNADYIHAVLVNGGVPVVLPHEVLMEDAGAVMSRLDGILFPGGEDVDPHLYGEEPLPVCGEFRPEIDAAWKNAFAYARSTGMPMLGICRGIQFINVMMGGTLWQDLDEMSKKHFMHLQAGRRSYLTHHVEITPGSYLEHLFGQSVVMTNSMHHQAVKEAAPGLSVSGRARDGVIEALEDKERTIVAVQWHPEGLLESNPVMNGLFADLVERSTAYGASK